MAREIDDEFKAELAEFARKHAEDGVTVSTPGEFLDIFLSWFAWIINDEDVSGGDAVEDLTTLYIGAAALVR